jgi:hypothetical protein
VALKEFCSWIEECSFPILCNELSIDETFGQNLQRRSGKRRQAAGLEELRANLRRLLLRLLGT